MTTKAQRAEYSRIWRKRHPERSHASVKAYYERTKERTAERRRAVAREWYARTRAKRLLQKQSYVSANMDKVLANNRNQKARRRSAEGKHTAQDIAELYEKQLGLCNICRIFLDSFQVDHVTSLKNGGSNWPSNLQLLCATCNNQKGTLDLADFVRRKGYTL